MKKYILIILVTTLLSSCKKENKCWVIMDCMGNDLYGYCESEKKVKEHIQSNQPAGCTWSYRPE